MARQVGGLGELGLAFETTKGTFLAPTEWIPIRSENIQETEAKQYRRNIRGLVDRQNPIQGYTQVEGPVTFEVTRTNLLYFLYAGRFTPVKTGTSPNFTYTFTPAHVTEPTTATGAAARKTLSLYVKRADRVFAYAGCSVGRFEFSVQDSILMCTVNILGLEETTESSAVASWTAETVYSAGAVSVNADAPASTARTDVDTITITIDDAATAENRIKTGGRGPQFIKWGEREITANFESDFDTKDDYTDFVNQTKWEVILKGSNNATSDEVQVKVNSVAIDAYEVGLSSIGDLVRANITTHGFYDTAAAAEIKVITTEDIT